MSALRVRHVIDVLAGVGQFATMIRRECRFTGKTDSFEPVGATYRALEEAFAGDPHGHRVAATTEPAAVEMQVFSDSVLNSLSRETDVGRLVFSACHDFR